MAADIKTFFSYIKLPLIFVAILISCLTFLYTYEQFDHLRLKISIVEGQNKVSIEKEAEYLEEINELKAKQEVLELNQKTLSTENVKRDTNLFLISIELNTLERMAQANYVCFSIEEYAKKQIKYCKTRKEDSRCSYYKKYENACLKHDTNGQRIISPRPDIYSQLLLRVSENSGGKRQKNINMSKVWR